MNDLLNRVLEIFVANKITNTGVFKFLMAKIEESRKMFTCGRMRYFEDEQTTSAVENMISSVATVEMFMYFF